MQQFFKGLPTNLRDMYYEYVFAVRLNFNICISEEKNTSNNNSKYNISFPFRVLSIVFFSKALLNTNT